MSELPQRGVRRHGFALLVLIALLAAPGLARAERCGPPVPWIEVHVRGDAWLTMLAPSFLADLRAGTHSRGIAACADVDPRSGIPGAIVVITAEHDVARVEVSTAQGAVEFRREVHVEGLPDDARSVSLASSIDEALRSNWAYLLRPEAPLDHDGAPVAAATAETAESDTEAADPSEAAESEAAPSAVETPPSMPTLALGIFARIDAFESAFVWPGAALSLRVRPIDHLELELSAEGGGGIPITTALGVVEGQRLLAHLALALSPMSYAESVRFHGSLAASLGAVWLEGQTNESLDGARALGWFLSLALGAELTVAVAGPVELEVLGQLGYALHGVYASEGSTTLTGLYGLFGGGRLGVLIWLD